MFKKELAKRRLCRRFEQKDAKDAKQNVEAIPCFLRDLVIFLFKLLGCGYAAAGSWCSSWLRQSGPTTPRCSLFWSRLSSLLAGSLLLVPASAAIVSGSSRRGKQKAARSTTHPLAHHGHGELESKSWAKEPVWSPRKESVFWRSLGE
jgi:hypothetical protein